MRVEIITIGDELLNGQVVDTNSAWIARELAPLHFHIVQITSIADTSEAILDALAAAALRADLVLVTGGLGPTNDDLTKQTIARYFDAQLIRSPEVLAHVEQLFSKYGYAEMPLINQQQADVLDCSEILFNDVGTAPGMWVESAGCTYAFLPGVPFEMKFLIQNRVVPRLAKFAAKEVIHNAYILSVGLGESHLARKIADIEAAMPSHIKLAYLPSLGVLRLRITAKGQDKQKLSAEAAHFVKQIVERLAELVVAQDERSFEEVIVGEFSRLGLSLSTAESCTGGYLSSVFTAVSGASQMFMGGAIVYSNASKMQLLAVQENTLIAFGAVSEQTVLEMAEGAKRTFNTDYAIATSGIAGPTGGTLDKPVGTICVAIVGKQESFVKTYHFTNDRQLNIQRTTAVALQELWSLYKKEHSKCPI